MATLLIFILNPSCKEEADVSEIIFPDSGVSYIKHVEPLFFNTCAFTGCHGEEPYDEYGLRLDSYQHAIAKTGIIIPGDPENSILIQRVEGSLSLMRMPPDRSPLNQNQINGLKTWIREGARLN